MKYFYGLPSVFLLSFALVSINTLAQEFNGEWSTELVTDDDNNNGTNQRTMSVAATTGENNFVALVSLQDAGEYFLVGYKNATDSTGRLGASFSSGDDPPQTLWISNFDQIFMEKPNDLVSYGDLIFVPNNDVNYNILVFEIKDDSVYSHPMRMSTKFDPFSIDSLWAIDIDDQGYVYVTTQGNETAPSKVLIYDSNDPEWSSGFIADPKQSFTLPDNGLAHGITANSDGTVIYVSNKDNGKIYAYVGNITDGYTLSPSFNYDNIDVYDVDETTTVNIGPLGLKFMNGNNILFAAADSYIDDSSSPTRTYGFGRMYLINPNTGEIMDTIDVAEWNYTQGDSSYTNHINNVTSGYTSTYYVDIDDNNDVYSQSFYGWTIEKWVYSGTLPTIELIITSIEMDITAIPSSFNLSQNYPNPFNPSTTIEFSITERAEVTLSVYSITGELITSLINGADLDAGVYNVKFDASLLSSGTYLYSISNGKTLLSKKMILLK